MEVRRIWGVLVVPGESTSGTGRRRRFLKQLENDEYGYGKGYSSLVQERSDIP
jgi:hypothetical protein